MAMQLLSKAKNNVAALELRRQLGVSYPHRLAHEAQDHGSQAHQLERRQGQTSFRQRPSLAFRY